MAYFEVPPFAEASAGKSRGIRLAYDVAGEGPPVVLVHGFASNRFVNWRGPGWIDTLAKAGRQAIAFDVRGHGESDKPHAREAYDEGELAADIVRLMDHLGLSEADVMGYSMGGFILLRLLRDHPDRVRKAVIGGLGANYFGQDGLRTDAIAAGLRAPSAADVSDPTVRQFRVFAEQSRNDLEALALCMTRPRRSLTAAELGAVRTPVLIVVGENDAITGPADGLAAALPGARIVVVSKRDHMSTVGDKAFKQAALDFLAEA